MATGWVPLSASNIQDAFKNKLVAGSLEVIPTDDHDRPVTATAGGDGGAILVRATDIAITNGALAPGVVIPDTTLTSPANISLRLSVLDPQGKPVFVLRGVQTTNPAGLNLDTYDPNVPKQSLIQTGPAGINFRGAWQPSTGYAARDAFSAPDGTLYYVSVAFTSDVSFAVSSNLTQLLTAGSPALTATAQQAASYATQNAAAIQVGNLPVAVNRGVPANNAIILGPNCLLGGSVESITANIYVLGASHSIDVIVEEAVGGFDFTLRRRFSLPVVNLGLQTWYAGLDYAPFTVASGGYIGFVSADTQVGYDVNATTDAFFASASVDPGAVGSTFTFAPSSNAYRIAFKASIKPVPQLALEQEVAALQITPSACIGGYDAVAGDVFATNYTFFQNEPLERSGLLQSISFFSAWSVGQPSVLRFFFMRPGSTPGTWQRATPTIPYDVNSTGVITLQRGIHFGDIQVSKGWVLSFHVPVVSGGPTGTGSIGLTTGVNARSGSLIYAFASSPHVPDLGIDVTPSPTLGGAGQIAVKYSVLATDPPLTARSMPYPNRRGTQLHSDTFAGTNLPHEWAANAGSWTANNGLVSPVVGSAAYSNFITSTRMYSVEQRRCRITFELLANGSVVAFGARPQINAAGSDGTLFVVSATDSTLKLYTWTGTADPALVLSVPLGFTLQAGRTYVLVTQADRRVNSATLTDPLTGLSATITDGTSAAGSIPFAASGLQFDYPVMMSILGQFKVHEHTVSASCIKPRVLILGDSYTQGSGIASPDRWPQLLSNQLPQPIAISGRGGLGIDSALAKAHTEMPQLAPDYVILAVGTNDIGILGSTVALWTAKLQAFLFQAARLNVQVIGTLIPPGAGRAQSTVNAFNAATLALASQMAAVLRFDRALTVNNDGTSQNSALYQVDGLHPTAAGHLALLARIAVDAPFLLD